jgi:hypothetical protein
MANIKFWTQEGSNQKTRFLNTKDHTAPEAKANHKLPLKPWQIKSSVKFDKRHQLPLKWRTQGFIKWAWTKLKASIGHSNNKANQGVYDLGTKATRARIVINDHEQNPLAIHNKKNVDHRGNSSHNRGRNQPTEIYTGDEHHDGTTWVVSKALWHKTVNKSSRTRSKHNLTCALHKRRTDQAAQEARYKIEQS